MMKKKGFTLIELIVVLGIIVLLLAIILPNYKIGGQQFALQRSANKLAQDIRRTQEMAMSMEKYNCGSKTLKGYGLYLSPKYVSATNYLLTAICDTDAPTVETLSFEKGVQIQDLAYYSGGQWQTDRTFLYFYFTAPDPVTTLMADAEQIKMTLFLKDDPSRKKIIKLNKAGLIEIE